MKSFKEYLEKRVIKKQSPNIARATDLIEESERKYRVLRDIIAKIGLNGDNANDIIESCYNILIFLIRAQLYKKGYKAEGFSAHEAEVSYLKDLDFSDADVQIMDNLRLYRNSMLYYGKKFEKENAETLFAFLERIRPKLKKKVEK